MFDVFSSSSHPLVSPSLAPATTTDAVTPITPATHTSSSDLLQALWAPGASLDDAASPLKSTATVVHDAAKLAPVYASLLAFNPATFKITPTGLATAVSQITMAITEGYSATSAIALLSKASIAANVSFDDMLVLTEAKLKATAGTAAATADKAFDAQILSRLTTGAAATSLAGLVHAGHLAAASASTILLQEAAKMTPTPAQEAHAVGQLLADFATDKLTDAQIEAVAKTDATLIISGVEKQTAPTATDLAAAARVYEAGLTAYSATAFAKLQAQFVGFDTTAAGITHLDQIEALALKDAVAAKQLTQAVANTWAAAFTAAQNEILAGKIAAIAAQYVSNPTAYYLADLAALKTYASTVAAADALLLMVASQPLSATLEVDVATFSNIAELFGHIDQAGLGKIVNELLTKMTTVPAGTVVSASALITLLQYALAPLSTNALGVAGAGLITEATAIQIITKAAASAGSGYATDLWLISFAKGLGSTTAITAAGAGAERLLFATANVMAARLKSGTFISDLVAQVKAGKMAAGSADALIHAFAPDAMANTGYASTPLTSTMTGTDGIDATDRIGYEVLQFVKAMQKTGTSAEITATENYVYTLDTAAMLHGLGMDSALTNDAGISADINWANTIIKAAETPQVQHLLQTTGGNTTAAFALAKTYAADMSQDFSDGLNAFDTLAEQSQLNQSEQKNASASPTVGLFSAGVAVIEDPGNFQRYIDLGANLLVAKIPDNPFGIISLIGDEEEKLVDDLGLGNLSGPFAAVVETVQGAIIGITTIADSVQTLLTHFAVATINATFDEMIGVGKAIFDAFDGLGGLVGDIFAGGNVFDDVSAFASKLAGDIADTVGTIIHDYVSVVLDPIISGFSQIADSIEQGAKEIGSEISNDFSGIGTAFTNFFHGIEGDIEDAGQEIASIY